MIVVIQLITNEKMIMHRYGYYREYCNCYQAYCMFGFCLGCNLVESFFFVGSKMDHLSIEFDEGAHLRGS